jgi:hypothetical protein
MSDYDRLSEWLRLQTSNRVNATFTQIERILSFDLPYSARTFPQWWENDPKHMQGKTWMGAGFRTLVYCLLNRFIFSSDRHILWWSCHAHLLTRCG